MEAPAGKSSRKLTGGCATIAPVMKDSEIIVGVLGGIGRRLWVGRALREAFFGLCVLLFFLIAFRLAGAVQPAGIPAAGIPAWLPIGIAMAALVA